MAIESGQCVKREPVVMEVFCMRDGAKIEIL